ncbi:venom acid phosphatase Acph-1-like isoform X2 [Prorops nasuta]
MREYKIGLMLRERYNGYFGPDYWPDLIYARSTVVARTQLSLQLVLAGLFSKPSQKQMWNPNLDWIPTWTFAAPLEEDYLLFPHYCQSYKDEYARLQKQKNIRDMVDKYKPVMEYLTEHSGKPINNTRGVYYLYNLLKEEAAQNLTLPEWTRSVYPKPMEEITRLDFHLRSFTKTLKRLNGGILLRKIVEDMQDLRGEKLVPEGRKAFLFGAHEVNVAALARTLGTNEPSLPSYGSTIILETLQDKKGLYYVRVILWTGVTEELIIQKIPGCTEICPFDDFLKLVKDVLPDDDEYKCQIVEDKKPHKNAAPSNTLQNRSFYLFALLAVLYGYFLALSCFAIGL